MSTSRMPAAFVGHGAPTVALDPDKGAAWRAWGAALPRPSGVLAVSAHWYEPRLVTGTERTVPLIYDFSGFPDALYRVEYAAPGAPTLASRVHELLGSRGVARAEQRGLDHGVWTPLVHMFPDADVPVLQLSIPSNASFADLVALGRSLAPLRDEGVLVLGSGNATHNLRRMRPDGTAPEAFASELDAWLAETLSSRDVDAMIDARTRAPAFRENHPTEEHFVPLLVALGAGGFGEDGEAARVTFPVTGFEYGNLSRRAVQLG